MLSLQNLIISNNNNPRIHIFAVIISYAVGILAIY